MIHLVTGGARAGKSTLVLREAEASPAARIAFIATAQPLDDEMRDRIARHRAERGPRWVTHEEPLALNTLLPALREEAIVVDCLTLWTANQMFAPGPDGAEASDAQVEAAIDALVAALAAVRVPTWLVTNEVGLGIVPDNAVSRRYRDLLGRCNQRVAALADRVTLVVAGLPIPAQVNGLLLGIGFLTRIPVRTRAPGPGDWGRAARAFPLAGGLVGLVGALAQLVGSALWTPTVGAVAAVAAVAWVTGALHLDGVADCVDGLACNGDRDRVLAVMHDPRVGAVGSVGTTLVLAAKIALVAACGEAGTGGVAVYAACVAARVALPFELAWGRPATPGRGLLAAMGPEIRPADALLAALVGVGLLGPALALVPAAVPGLALGVGLAALASAGWARAWTRRLGGLTGDVLGAAVELRELVLLGAMGLSVVGA